MTRLFAALDFPDEIKNQIIEIRNTVTNVPANFRWEPKEKLHLTLKFIGDVDDSKVDQIADSLNFIEDFQSIYCKLTRFGFFYRDNKPNILWLGMDTDENLKKLVSEINDKLAVFGIPVEKRKFHPHLTLKRIKERVDRSFTEKFSKFDFPKIEFNADTITLFKSELLKSGSVYTKIKKYKLKRLEE